MPAYSFTYVNGKPIATQGPSVPSADHLPSFMAIDNLSATTIHINLHGIQQEHPNPGAALQEVIDEFTRHAVKEAGSLLLGCEWGTRIDITAADQFNDKHPCYTLSKEVDNERDPNDIS